MIEIEKGEEKIQKICDAIRQETLEPAREQAREIIENAHIEADEIIKKAKKEKDRIIDEGKKEIVKEKKVFDSSLNIAARQAFEDLKQKIENELFSKNLDEIIKNQTKNPAIIAKIITTILSAIEKEGLDVDISAYLAKDIDAKAVNILLVNEIVDKLKEKEAVLSDFDSGVKIKLHDLQITIDLSKDALKNLIAEYIRADFRNVIFNI
ncbi:MAG: V-type ATP synthase subunit E [Parachlamydiales bacterium]|nr:V-type ATP synthase subunit E [Parachlamydiales bacterium]